MKRKKTLSVCVIERDPTMGIQCWLCNTSEQTEFGTEIELVTPGDNYQGFTICIEHADAIVNALLQRHAVEVTTGNPTWFINPDQEA